MVMGTPSGIHFFGCMLALSSTVIVAIWIHWSRSIMKTIAVSDFTALTTVIGTLFLIPCTMLLTDTWQIHLTFRGVIALLYLGIGCSLAAGWLWNTGLKNADPNASGLFLALEPVFGVIFAAILLSEHLSSKAIMGAALVLIPIIIAAEQKRKYAVEKI